MRGGSPNGMAPLCVKDRRKAQAAAVAAAADASAGRSGENGHVVGCKGSVAGRGNGHNNAKRSCSVGCSGLSGAASSGSARGSGGGDGRNNRTGVGSECTGGARGSHINSEPPVVKIERAEIIRMASQYTPCAGCSAAVKGLLQRPIEELRLVNAVMEERKEVDGPMGGSNRRSKRGRGGGGRMGAWGGRGGGGGGDSRQHHHSNGGGTANGSPAAAAAVAVMHNDDERCSHGCSGHDPGSGHHHHHPCSLEHPDSHPHPSSSITVGAPVVVWEPPRAMCLREAYLIDRVRLDQLLETFPLEGLMKKVQPKGVGLRCEIHRRNGGQATADGWEWEDAWDRLPADMRLKVAAVDVDALEAAMHQATSTHRFCADCKHNVVTAFDILTCKCDLADIENEEEFLPDLFWPFAGRIGPVPGDVTGQKALLTCPLEDVEELICWHEDFDSREYTRNSQRHAATLEHGQREIRSIVGSVLLTQLRANYHNHLAQVQAEQYLFALVLHAIRTRLEGSGRGLRNGRGAGAGAGAGGSGSAWGSGFGGGGPSACPRCGGGEDPGCQICHGTGVSLSELGYDVDNGDKKAKTKSKKKRERKARAKAAKKSQEEENGGIGEGGEGAETASNGGVECNGHGGSHSAAAGGGGGGAGGGGERNHARHTTARGAKSNGQQQQRPKAKVAGGVSNGSTVGIGGALGLGGSAAAGRPRGGSGHRGGKGQTAARTRAGSSGMESAGSLLSMLGGGDGGGGMDEREGDDGNDEGIDEDLVREMERLRMLKAQTDVQRTRAALRSNLQKNFAQLLVSSTARDAAGGRRGDGSRNAR